uniref:Uncharacterized protein n=1 Tax=Anguilla anguilla TaxID=7936 RepID=A0A0E9R029_ANGAN
MLVSRYNAAVNLLNRFTDPAISFRAPLISPSSGPYPIKHKGVFPIPFHTTAPLE